MGYPEIEDQEMEDSMHARGCVWPAQEGVNPPRNYSFRRANARKEEVFGGSTGHKWELADQEKAKPPHCRQCSQPERRRKAPISRMGKRL